MHKPLYRILLWLAVMAILTLLAMGVWLVVWGGNQSTESLKWLQFLQMLGTFAFPPILCAWLWNNRQPFTWLKLDQPHPWRTALFAISIMICALPAVNLFADLNSRIVLPKSLDFIEHFFKQQEETAALLTERFLQADNFGTLLINIGLMALLPALAEELSFRGTLQQIINHKSTNTNTHIAIWVTAIVFSAIHMQFYGFIPRMFLGAMFGYIFLWTGNLWAPILMHFTNNVIAVITHYLTTHNQTLTAVDKNWADTFGAGSTWWVGVLSLLITSLGLLIFARRIRKE